MFSSRLPAVLAPNAISRAVSALRGSVPLLDLTETNPTLVGLFAGGDVLDALATADGVHYRPDAAGLEAARRAVAADYARQHVTIDPGHLILTSSTSEAYAFLFKLLADPGDEVLVPEPSYPLFESLTGLEAVRARPYALEYHGTWSMNRESVDRVMTSRTRAILVVNPNNPTGSMLRSGDRDWLVSRCEASGVALIADEVFAGYPLHPAADAVSLAGEMRALTFVLGGLSKSSGLPQMKLAWIAVSGPDATVRDAIGRLEIIADTYLSVSTPVQLAVESLLAAGAGIRARIQERITANFAVLTELAEDHGSISVLRPEGGWSAVLRVPATIPEEALVLRLLHDTHVVVHPGFFFDFPDEAYLIVSLLPEPHVFRTAIRRLLPIAAGLTSGPQEISE